MLSQFSENRMLKANVNPYPGFDETGNYYEPRPAPRVRPEAEEYAGKNKGCIDLFNDRKHTHVIQPPSSPRCPSNAAKQNYELSHTGNGVGSLLGGKGPSPAVQPIPAPRVTPAGEGIAENHKGHSMNILMVNYGHQRPSPRPAPRVKVEAEETATKSLGGRMDSLMHDPKSIPGTPRNPPRVKPEAEEISLNGQGANMTKIMGRYGETPRSTRAVARVKREAEQYAELDKGKQMANVFYDYGTPNAVPKPEPKVKDGKLIAGLDQGGRMSRLMHDSDKMRGDPKPPPRASDSAGRRNIKKNRGQISKIFSDTSKWQIVPTPGVRN